MAAGSNIIAHDNLFNKSVLEGSAHFFTQPQDIVCILNEYESKICSNYRKSVSEIIRDKYSWEKVVSQHIKLFEKVLN